MPTHGALTSILHRLTHARPRGARTHQARSAARTCRAAALGRVMRVSAAARDPSTAAAAVQRVAEESEELSRILRIEARPLKQAVGGSCGEASAPELDLIIIKDPGSASSSTIRTSCSLHPTALIRAQPREPAAGALDMSSAATRCCTPSPSVARDLVHIQKIAVRTVLPSRHERRQGGS